MLLAPYVQNEIDDNHIECDGAADTPAEITPWSALSAQELEGKQPRIRLGAFSAVRAGIVSSNLIRGGKRSLELTATMEQSTILGNAPSGDNIGG